MSATKPRYHHGNLRAALLEAGLELAAEGGPDAVVLREASRRVGVSHNAAYRHFPDRDALLAEVGLECMRRLAALMEALIAEVNPDDRTILAAQARLRATGTAYVRFALAEPGLFRTAFCLAGAAPHGGVDAAQTAPTARIADAAPRSLPGELGPFGVLQRQLDELLDAGGLTPERRPYADYAAWSAVHGFSMLMLEPLQAMPQAMREDALTRLLDTIQDGLAA